MDGESYFESEISEIKRIQDNILRSAIMISGHARPILLGYDKNTDDYFVSLYGQKLPFAEAQRLVKRLDNHHCALERIKVLSHQNSVLRTEVSFLESNDRNSLMTLIMGVFIGIASCLVIFFAYMSL